MEGKWRGAQGKGADADAAPTGPCHAMAISGVASHKNWGII
jgi:hypothetical protein